MLKKELQEGIKAPNFELPAAPSGNLVSLDDFLGNKNVVLYFYPKDMTSGCTKEAQGFRDYYLKFKDLDTEILGISKDSLERHNKFIEKENIPFLLLSDEDAKVCGLYGVWKEKSMYGRKYMGIERSTFIIDKSGIIRKIYRKVSVPGHVEDVYMSCKAIVK